MKFLRILGGFLFGLGCVAALIGLLALLLPMIENDQLKLVLESFETPSENPIVNIINTVMTYALYNCYVVMLMGAGTFLLGAVLMLYGKNSKAAAPEKSVAGDEGAAYVVAGDAADAADIPVWKQGDKPAERINPYADASVAEMLAPNPAGGTVGSTTNPFAPPDADDTNTPAYKKPDAYTPDRKHHKAPKEQNSASDAGNADHLFDLIRRYGAEKENGGENGITVSLTTPAHADEPAAQIQVVLDEGAADVPPEGFAPPAPPAPPEVPRYPEYPAPAEGYAPREAARYPEYPAPPEAPRYPEYLAPREAPRYTAPVERPRPAPREAARRSAPPGARMRIHGYDARRSSTGGTMHILQSIAPSASQRYEETIYRAPSYKPRDTGGRPRIRSTFPVRREDDRAYALQDDDYLSE